jgi:hypothetical protein
MRPYFNADRLAKKLARVSSTIAEGNLLLGKLLGVGGDTWTVQAAFGDGLSEAAELGVAGTWTGYVYRSTEPEARQSATGTPVAGAEWLAVGVAATYQSTRTADGVASLEAGMTLTSVDDPALSFTLIASDYVDGYAQYQVRPK